MKIIVITGNGNDRCYRLMADSTMLVGNKPFFIPDFAPEFVLHPALAVRIDRLGKNIAPRFAHRYYQSASACAVVEAKVDDSSSSSDQCLRSYAIRAARLSKFSIKSYAPSKQSGYIIYSFIAQ